MSIASISLLKLSSCARMEFTTLTALPLVKLVIKYLLRPERKIEIAFHIDHCQVILAGLTIHLHLSPLQRIWLLEGCHELIDP